MATYYSAFFSSGLLATPPTTTDAPALPLDDPNTTPTAHDFTEATTKPRLRRRKSSMTINASPVSALKSSTTTTATQRHHSLMAPVTIRSNNRSRSGSMTDSRVQFNGRVGAGGNDATQGNSLIGRLRSGSLSALRARRPARKQPPPPTLPLPALPSTQPPSTPRRPFVHRSHTDSLLIPIYTPPVPRTLTPESGLAGLTLQDSPMLPPGLLQRTRLDMDVDDDVDYPSPVDTPIEEKHPGGVEGYFDNIPEQRPN